MRELLLGDMQRYYGHIPSLKEKIKFFIHPRTQATAFFRLSQWCLQHELKPLADVLELINMILWGCEMSPKMEIGKGFLVEHTLGVGLAFTRAGKNFTVNMGVIVAGEGHDPEYDRQKRPRFGDDVTLHIGAKVFGGIDIGDNVIVGANSVLNRSVPSNCIVAGAPARIIKHLPGYVPPADSTGYCKDITGKEQ